MKIQMKAINGQSYLLRIKLFSEFSQNNFHPNLLLSRRSSFMCRHTHGRNPNPLKEFVQDTAKISNLFRRLVNPLKYWESTNTYDQCGACLHEH